MTEAVAGRVVLHEVVTIKRAGVVEVGDALRQIEPEEGCRQLDEVPDQPIAIGKDICSRGILE